MNAHSFKSVNSLNKLLIRFKKLLCVNLNLETSPIIYVEKFVLLVASKDW